MTAATKLIASVEWRPAKVEEATALELGRFGKLTRFHLVEHRTHSEGYFRVQGDSSLLVKIVTYSSNKWNEYFVGEAVNPQLSLLSLQESLL